jgi:hypothetical protein
LSWGARRELYRQEKARRKERAKEQEYRFAEAMKKRLNGPETTRDLREAAKSMQISLLRRLS